MWKDMIPIPVLLYWLNAIRLRLRGYPNFLFLGQRFFNNCILLFLVLLNIVKAR
jgi:hypothetical protein